MYFCIPLARTPCIVTALQVDPAVSILRHLTQQTSYKQKDIPM